MAKVAKDFARFNKTLLKAKTEEEVKHAYADHFGLEYPGFKSLPPRLHQG